MSSAMVTNNNQNIKNPGSLFYTKNDSKLADQNFLKHKSDKKYFFLLKYNTYGFIVNSGQ